MNVPQVQGTGMTRRKLKGPSCRGTKFSSTKGNNQGKPAKIVSYCPYCPPVQADPEKSPQVPARNATIGKCKAGHSWPVGGQSYAGARIKPVEKAA